MKPFQKLKVVAYLLCFFIFQNQNLVFANNIYNDTIPSYLSSYELKNQRLTISSIKILKISGKTAKIEYNLSNSGREKIKLGKERILSKTLVFEFDASLNSTELYDYANAIATAISNQKLSLNPGQRIMGNKLKVDISNSNDDLIVIRSESKNENPENTDFVKDAAIPIPIDEEITEVENQEVLTTEKNNSEVAETEKIIEVVEEPIQETEIITESETVVEISDPIRIESEIKEDIESIPSNLEEAESIIVEDPKTSETKDLADLDKLKEEIKEEILLPEVVGKVEEEMSVPEVIINEDIIVETEVQEESKTEIAEVEKDENISETVDAIDEVINEISEIVNEDVAEIEEKQVEDQEYLNETICADLVIESIRVLKQNERSVTLEYVLANYGNGSAHLFGESSKEDDNVAIKAHLAKSRRLTRGSIPLKGVFISKGVKNKSGLLLPKDKIKTTMKLDISKMTKFTPVLILSLDGFHDVEECNEDNNKVFIDLIISTSMETEVPCPDTDIKVLSKN